VTGQNIDRTFADNGNYNVVPTVTDKDGGATQQSIAVAVDNVAPTVGSIVNHLDTDHKPNKTITVNARAIAIKLLS
jgi:hypothetical protein